MRIVNFGSINIDHIYRVDHIVKKGETVACGEYAVSGGGKGANQSIAVAHAGGTVVHIGKVGREAQWMVNDMKKAGVDVSKIVVCDKPGGHAIIQVDNDGQNSIVVFGGTNLMITREEIDCALASCVANDMVLLQNEINDVPYILGQTARRSLRVCFNPAPMDSRVPRYDLGGVSLLVVNETEAQALTGTTTPAAMIRALLVRSPKDGIVLTLGNKGVRYAGTHRKYSIPALKVKAVDTTGAGDTFIGYLLAALQKQFSMLEALTLANTAAAISVTRMGAAVSIPLLHEVEQMSV